MYGKRVHGLTKKKNSTQVPHRAPCAEILGLLEESFEVERTPHSSPSSGAMCRNLGFIGGVFWNCKGTTFQIGSSKKMNSTQVPHRAPYEEILGLLEGS